MKTFNQQARNIMKIKQRTEQRLYYVSAFAWGVICFVTGSLLLFAIEIVSIDNWPF